MEQITFLQFLLEFAIATFGSTILLAIKHIFAFTFNWKEFWKDSLLPLILSFGGGTVIALVEWFFPQFTFFIEAATGEEVSLDHQTLVLTGAALVVFIKGLLKVKETKEKVKKAKK